MRIAAIGALLFACATARADTMILTYHDFVPKRDAHALWFDCTPAEFERQLDWMQKRGAHFISLGRLYEHLTHLVKLPTHPVVLTFADNYEGFYRYAWPILRRRKIPSAMFIHTGYVGDRAHGRPKMTWVQLKELTASGLFTPASQTVSHPADLGALPCASIESELRNSKAKLESELGVPIAFLAYPNGKFNSTCMELAAKAGYAMAFTESCHPAEAANSWMAVPRYVHTKIKQAWRDAFGP